MSIRQISQQSTPVYLLEQSAPEAAEVAVLGVVNFSDTPRVDPSTDGLAVNLNLLFGTNDGERHHGLYDTIRHRAR